MRSTKDRQKIIYKGITILRVREDKLAIWKFDTFKVSWIQLKKFETKSALEKEIKRIDSEEPNQIFE